MKWITITPDGESKSGKTRQWVVRSKEPDLEVGSVRWLPKWKRYVFWPVLGSKFQEEILTDLAEFVASATREHYENAKVARKAKDPAGA